MGGLIEEKLTSPTAGFHKHLKVSSEKAEVLLSAWWLFGCFDHFFFLFKTPGQLLGRWFIKGKERLRNSVIKWSSASWQTWKVNGIVTGPAQVCTGNCCCEVDCIRASAQCFSCVTVHGMNLSRPRSHSTNLPITLVCTNGRCVTVLPPHCRVAWAILQSLEWRTTGITVCFLPVPMKAHCWDAEKLFANKILL